MNGGSQVSGVIRVAAQARWGDEVTCELAARNGRYFGPVFLLQDFLIQRVGPCQAIVHSRYGINFSTTESLQRRLEANHLNDSLLAIYYVGTKRTAYLRSMRRARRHPPVLERLSAALGSTVPVNVRQPRRVTTTVATAVAASLALAACASKYALVTPDGSDRVAVNTPESLAKYQDVVARQDAMMLERSVLEQKVDALNIQVVALKAYLLEQQGKAKVGDAAPGPSPESPAALPPPTGATSTVTGEKRVVFRVNLPIGQTDFILTESLKVKILRAARMAQSIVIRGRTDADEVDPLETRIALGRALRARQFLIANGVQPGKIRTWYRASGGFIADNATAEGRALNRRVEIEVHGIDLGAIALNRADARLGSVP